MPQTWPLQQTPFWHVWPLVQQLTLPQTVVPAGQQPPAGSGVPWQQMPPAHVAPCWQHVPPHTTPDAQQMPATHAVPALQHIVPQTCCPCWQQPPVGSAPPAGPAWLNAFGVGGEGGGGKR